MKIEDLFAHKSFRKLEQLKTHWQITHISHDGVSLASLCDKDFDRLLSTYGDVVESIDSVSEGDSGHEHQFLREWEDGNLICKCGAWK